MDYKKYFKLLIQKNGERKREFPNEKVFSHSNKHHYADIFGYRGFKYNFVISPQRSRAYGADFIGLIVELYIDKEYHQSYFNQLKEHQDSIERDLDMEGIVWQSSEDAPRGNVCRVYAKKDVNIDDTFKWDEYADWQINTMLKFLEVLPNYTEGLKAISQSINLKRNPPLKNNLHVKNIILYGPPGVGKTHNVNRLVSLIEQGKSSKQTFNVIVGNTEFKGINNTFKTIKEENRLAFVTFHQSFSYEDFIEGYRPNNNGNIQLEDGIFKNIATRASTNQSQNHYLIIDEINRGNISKIFGELITLIEEDKRDNIEVTLPYSKEPFKVPSNLYIIATMNSTDKSIALIDIALRRRFTFLKMKPDSALIEDKKAKVVFENINVFILDTLGADFQIGHSYFMNFDNLDFVLEYKIKPLLEEYFFADPNRLEEAMKLLESEL